MSANRWAAPLWVQLTGTLLVLTSIIAYVSGETIRESESTRLFERAQLQMEQQLSLLGSNLFDVLDVESGNAEVEQALSRELEKFMVLMKDVAHVDVRNAQDELLASWSRPTAATKDLKLLTAGISRAGRQLGKLQTRWDANEAYVLIEKDVADVRTNIFLVMMFTAGVVSLWICAVISWPLKNIQNHLARRNPGERLVFPAWMSTEFHQLKDVVERLDEMGSDNEKLAQEMERRKDVEVELLKVRDEAMEANHAKSIFLANMSHELRTPLNAIIGFSEIMEEDMRSNEELEYAADLEKIHLAGLHLLELINGILDLSKIEEGEMHLYLESFSLADVVDVTVKTMEPMLLKTGNVIQLTGLDVIPVMKADLTKVRQILYNLLSNAIKFTEHGTIVVKAMQKADFEIHGVEISISDSGVGMTPEDMENIFVPFQQADVSTTRKYGGTGLGLALCRRLSDMMQGQIRVCSELGKGSIFSVWLPLNVMEKKYSPQDIAFINKKIMDPKKVRLPDDVMRQYRGEERRKKIATVLTIDDDPAVLDLMARVYQREGFRLVSAANGNAGIDLAHKLRPELIVLDVMMPEVDGWAVLETLKETAGLKHIPVIMVDNVENKKRAMERGALDSLGKPIDWDRLIDLTRKVVRKNN